MKNRRLHMKIICQKHHYIKTPSTHERYLRNNRTREKLTNFLRTLQTSRANSLRILTIKKVKI